VSGVGLGLLPRLPPPTCARPVSGVGLGPSCSPASWLWFPGPRPLPDFRSAICDCLSLNVFGPWKRLKPGAAVTCALTPSLRSLSLAAFRALSFTFFQLVVIKRIILSASLRETVVAKKHCMFLWPQLPPPTCSRRVRSVGLGPFSYVGFLPRSPAPC